MAWKKVSTTVRVEAEADLGDADTEQLLQELIFRGLLRESEAEAIAERRKNDFAASAYLRLKADDFGVALDEIRRGRRIEALIHIERALGGEFIGRLAG